MSLVLFSLPGFFDTAGGIAEQVLDKPEFVLTLSWHLGPKTLAKKQSRVNLLRTRH